MSLNTSIRDVRSLEDLARILADTFRTGMASETAYEIEAALERLESNPVCKTHGDDLVCITCVGPDVCEDCEGALTCVKCVAPAPPKS